MAVGRGGGGGLAQGLGGGGLGKERAKGKPPHGPARHTTGTRYLTKPLGEGGRAGGVAYEDRARLPRGRLSARPIPPCHNHYHIHIQTHPPPSAPSPHPPHRGHTEPHDTRCTRPSHTTTHADGPGGVALRGTGATAHGVVVVVVKHCTASYGALDSHPFVPSHVASGRCVLSAAAAGAPAGAISAFAEPSSWRVGAVLNVAGCAVCASAAPNNWRIEGAPPPQPPDDEMTITKFSRPVLANFDPFVSFFVICDPNHIHLHVQCIPLINLMGLMGFFFWKKMFLVIFVIWDHF